MDATIPALALAPLDSARVVATVYSLSLVSFVPFAAAAVVAVLVRRMPAGTRALVWRAAIVTLLVIGGAQLVPVRWEAWVLPATLADPLIALGRHTMRAGVPRADMATPFLPAGAATATLVVSLLGALYLAGVAAVMASAAIAIVRARRLVASAHPVHDPAWRSAFEEVRQGLGISRPVPLLVSPRIAVPMTVGMWRPAVVIPAGSLDLPPGARHAVLLHELAHVRAADVAYGLAALFACALLWFHPAAWWVARGLRRESEMACDDCVLAGGIRQSEYALLLAEAADHIAASHAGSRRVFPAAAASAFTGKGALRERLTAITAVGLDRRAPQRTARLLALAAAVLAAPLGLVELEPTRGVLRSLMSDGRWESRAYAARGLAPRPDSISVTLQAATSDPSPHVRAWAAYALARRATAGGDALQRASSRQD